MKALRKPRVGTSLVDVIAAATLTTAVLVPSVRVLQESVNTNGRLQQKSEMLNQCGTLLERELQRLSSGGRLRINRGAVSTAEGRMRYEVIASDRISLGGLPNELIAVSVVVWQDEIRNNRHDTREPHVSLYSKISTP